MQNIKKIYLYLVSLVSLIILVVAGIMLINLGLKTWVFPKADKNYYSYPSIACSAPADAKTPTKPGECDPAVQEQQKKADEENRAAQKQRDAAQALAMIIVASPVFYFHWRLARKEQ